MMWLAMFMLCGMTGYAAETAQSVLSIDPVSFSNKDKKMVAVNFENKEPIAGMQFDVILPSFLEFDGDEAEWNPKRRKTHYCQMNPVSVWKHNCKGHRLFRRSLLRKRTTVVAAYFYSSGRLFTLPCHGDAFIGQGIRETRHSHDYRIQFRGRLPSGRIPA